MTRKVIFIIASVLVFLSLDLVWIYPALFNHPPTLLSLAVSSLLLGLESSAIIAEWHFLEW
jgi:hypothetical protein